MNLTKGWFKRQAKKVKEEIAKWPKHKQETMLCPNGYTSAFEEGKAAHKNGVDFSLNPYDESDVQYDEWEDGWIDEWWPE